MNLMEDLEKDKWEEPDDCIFEEEDDIVDDNWDEDLEDWQ